MNKTFLHISEEFEYTWLGKDNGMIPIYMSEKLGYNSKILTVNLKNDLPDNERGVEFIKVKRKFAFLSNFAYWTKLVKRYNIFKYLIKNAKNIDVLMLFHVSRCSYWYAHIYKKLNPNGFIYVKADFNLAVYQKEWNIVNSKPKSLREFFRKRRESAEYNKRKKLIPMTDLISYESLEAYEFMKYSYAGINTKDKTIYLPNGYDNEIIEKIKVKTSEEKENRVIEMLLTTVESKVLLSGKIISLVILGLLQCMVIIIPILFGFFILKSAGTIEGLNIPNIVFEPGSFLLSFCFFALSYLLYAGILLTVGSAMPTAQEASSYVGVFMMFLFMPLYMVQALVSTPDALISKFLTFFPLTSPIPLLIRNTVGNLSTSDTIIAIVIMLISVFVVLKLSVIAFKNGSLQYSRKLKLKELLKSA